ncbi:hypothetical protein BE11_50135 [Sorangium cellulosum]|nr:hypothetical protein BE11_50135 [Sorangium cellulosum]
MGLCVAFSLLGTGCMKYSAYYNALDDIGHIEHLISPATGEDGKPLPSPMMELPRIKARVCLRRAIESYRAANWSTGWDMAMLVIAGGAAGVGTSLGVASSTMDDTRADGTRNAAKKDLAIASVTTIAAGGAVLALRTALALDDVGRAQRIAAARDVNTAINILEKYALTDDPKDVGDDGFGACRDEDVNIANAFPGAQSAASLEKLLAKTKEEARDAAEDAAEAKAEAESAEKKAEASREDVAALQKLQDTMHALNSPAEGTPKKGGAAATEQTDRKIRETEKALEEAKVRQAKQEEEARKAKLDAARAAVEAARAELAAKKATVLQVGGQLRRAVFYLTRNDVELAQGGLDAAIAEAEGSRNALKAAEKRLEGLLFGSK